MNKNRNKRMILCIVSALVLVLLDRFAKIWAAENLADNNVVWIIKDALQLYYLPYGNKGAAWGILEGHQALFVVIAIIVNAAIFYIIYNIPEDHKFRFLTVMLTFIAAGGLGNMYDRIVQGYVIDFIYFSLINFPIFNVADIYVSVCTVLLCLYLIFKVSEEDFKVLEAAMKKPFLKTK